MFNALPKILLPKTFYSHQYYIYLHITFFFVKGGKFITYYTSLKAKNYYILIDFFIYMRTFTNEYKMTLELSNIIITMIFCTLIRN